jgi:hypothetical protein
MNEKFESQKERLLSIKQEISLLYQQVNYLLRNEKPLELLDLDVLMNRTHTLYDQLCAINIGDESLGEDLPFDAEAFSGLFGGMVQEESQEEEPEEENVPEEGAPATQEDVPEPEKKFVEEVPEPIEEPTPVVEPELVEEPELVMKVEPVEETAVEVEEAPVMETVEEPAPEVEMPTEEKAAVEVEPESEPEDRPLSDEFGLFFRFEDIPEKGGQIVEDHPIVEMDGKVVHVMEEIPEEEIPERDRVHGDDLVHDNPLEMPQVEDEIPGVEPFGDEKPVSDGLTNVFDNDEAEFELSTGETLGEKMMGDDHSLAAKLQQTPGRDLKSVIGINDKFLFVNELFGGSMEKYNKSIENLNDLKTLNGAMIYLNELKIELQWNSSNEAYLKLKDLVSRKFE